MVMCDDDDRSLLLVRNAPEEIHHGAPALTVESSRRLIGENEGGPIRESSRDRDALLLAAAESVRERSRSMSDAEVLEKLVCALLGRVAFSNFAGDLDVPSRVQEWDQVWLLEDESDVGSPEVTDVCDGATLLEDTMAVHPKVAPIRARYEAEHFDESGLPRATGSEERDDLPALEDQIRVS